MIRAVLAEGVVGRAVDRGVLQVGLHDLRDYSTDRHRTVDDVPYGGGPGMVLKSDLFFRALAKIGRDHGESDAVVMLSPQGRVFSHEEAERLGQLDHVTLLCGRYEGVDERVREQLATDELSIGDYVLSGGELPAAVVLDAVARLIPGVVGDRQSVVEDSFVRGMLDHPHYTRPAEIEGHGVPDVLLSGHHGQIRYWRRRAAISRTLDRRPDLLERADLDLDDEERAILQELRKEKERQ
jgi:tRNA (guanine37-N1)-methyltransferase